MRADGGVLQVGGSADSPGQLALVREVLGRIAGVYAVWDSVVVAGRVPRVVDLGCGAVTQDPDAVGVDRLPSPAADVLADPCWWPRHAASDGATVFADLTPVDPGGEPATPEPLARFFD